MKHLKTILAAALLTVHATEMNAAGTFAAGTSEPGTDSLRTCLQTEKSKGFYANFGIDMLSSYICRGAYQTGASFQPKFNIGYKGFEFAAWGSSDFACSDMIEVDLTLSYAYRGLKLALTDYYVSGNPLRWGGDKGDARPFRNFFDTNSRTTPHVVELAVYWTVCEKVPVTLQWGTMFFGNDYNDEGRRNFTSYFEISYPFTILDRIDMKAGIGGTPWGTNLFKTPGFCITNVYLNASRFWNIKDDFRIGLHSRLICNPLMEQFNFVGGLTFII